MKQVLVVTRFDAGMTVYGDKQGPVGSFLNGRSIDFRKRPNQISVLPGTAQIGQGQIDDLIVDMIQVADGTRYALGDTGKFYKISTSNVVTQEGDIGSSGYSLVYRPDLDRIVICGATGASSYYPVSGSPTSPVLEHSKYGNSASTSAVRTGGSLTYTVPTSITESATAMLSFLPDIEPLVSVSLYVVTKGTGNWTLTLHDDANNVLGTKTIANASLTNNTLNEFTFSAPVRMLVKPNARTYHVHATSTVADGTVAVSTKDDFSTANLTITAARFVTPNNGLHPAIQFLQYICIGNERYLSAWEPLETNPTNSQWVRHQLTFPPGYEVCGLALYNEFLAIACEKRSTSSTKDFQDGRIFFWNGIDTTYNFFIDVPEGSPYSLHSYKNVLHWTAGNAWWGYSGGAPIKLKTFPNTDTEFSSIAASTVVYPNMSTVRNGILLMGFPSLTTSQTVEHGVYSWGAIDKNYPNSFGYSYVMSTGSRTNTGSNNLRLGMVKNFGDSLYISWQDDTNNPSHYGLDVVNSSSAPASTASYESLISDNGTPYKRKSAYQLFATFAGALPAGATVTLKYKLDRAATWTSLTAVSSGSWAMFDLGGKQYYDIQFGADITCGALTVTLASIGLVFDDGKAETIILGPNG